MDLIDRPPKCQLSAAGSVRLPPLRSVQLFRRHLKTFFIERSYIIVSRLVALKS